MKNESDQPISDQKAWLIIGAVFLSLVFVLGIVYMREKEKPHSPHALVAAGFAQMFTVKEWKPGMGKKPFLYHPAAANTPVWMPLPGRSSILPGQGVGSSPNYALAAGG